MPKNENWYPLNPKILSIKNKMGKTQTNFFIFFPFWNFILNIKKIKQIYAISIQFYVSNEMVFFENINQEFLIKRFQY